MNTGAKQPAAPLFLQARLASATFRPELVPTWAKMAAWAVPLTTIPSITWRLANVLGGLGSRDPCAVGAGAPRWEQLYLLVVLPVVQLGLALLTVGLIRPWGEVLPRWLPLLGGRRVPVAVAVGAATGGVVLVAVWLWIGLVMDLLGVPPTPLKPGPPGCSVPGWEVLRWYAPMLLWPPLLLAVTWHYLRRRRRQPAPAPSLTGHESR
jgi:hypothetical protein